MYALGVVRPVGATICPSIGQGASPLVEVRGLIGIRADDCLDMEVVLKAFQGRDEKRLRVGQADQPDMGNPFGLVVPSRQFGAEIVVILQPASGKHLTVAGLKGRQIIPARLLRVLWERCYTGKIQTLGRTTQFIAQLEQSLRQTLRLLEGELAQFTVREQMGQGGAIGRLQDLDPGHQRIRRTRRLGVRIPEVKEVGRRLEDGKQDSVGSLLRQLFLNESRCEARRHDYSVGPQVDGCSSPALK